MCVKFHPFHPLPGCATAEASSEIKRNIHSTRFRFAVQLNDRGGSIIFIWGGAAGPGDADLAIEGVSNLLIGRRHGRKGAFSCQKGGSVGGMDAISA